MATSTNRSFKIASLHFSKFFAIIPVRSTSTNLDELSSICTGKNGAQNMKIKVNRNSPLCARVFP